MAASFLSCHVLLSNPFIRTEGSAFLNNFEKPITSLNYKNKSKNLFVPKSIASPKISLPVEESTDKETLKKKNDPELGISTDNISINRIPVENFQNINNLNYTSTRESSNARKIFDEIRASRKGKEQKAVENHASNLSLSSVFSKAASRMLLGVLESSVTEEPVVNDQSYEGNWKSVQEIGDAAGPLPVVSGKIPTDFPRGMYIRNGPNPFFEPLKKKFLLGSSRHHLFEGDGMLHGTWITENGAFYLNRFVETEGLALDKEAGKSSFWGGFNGDPGGVAAGFIFNLIRSGKVFKKVANTNVISHHGKVFALNEASCPVEIKVPSMETVGEYNFNGQLNTSCTAHPKIDPKTGELIFFSYQVSAPEVTVYVASPAGKIVHSVGLDIGRGTPMHDFGITENYTIVLDESLTIDPRRLMEGKPLVEFEPEGVMRFGVLPRYGSSDSIKWFQVAPGFTFHFMNSYEDGNEVVIHAFRQKMAVLREPEGQTWAEFLPQQFLAPDGELLAHLHEWRLNMETGQVIERQLGKNGFSCEFPRINDKYTGRKYKYGYGAVTDIENSVNKGELQLYGSIAKFYLAGTSTPSDLPVNPEIHSFGPGRYGGEATFVARADANSEDDGFLVTYVYDEADGTSEFYVIDAKNMEGEPVARITLPQRVPYGFHGNFIEETLMV